MIDPAGSHQNERSLRKGRVDEKRSACWRWVGVASPVAALRPFDYAQGRLYGSEVLAFGRAFTASFDSLRSLRTG
ncbi:MAG: hypothetical protein WA634_12370 [Silvibacterium sp.]